jgi:FAD/FMN-containing dehydrogenase
MSDATDGDWVGVEQAVIAELRASLHGEVIGRLHPGYDRARRVWNGLIDRHPAAIARCADTADVVQTVRIVRERHPTVSIRGGGHQVAGSAVCDEGLVIDPSAMRGVPHEQSVGTATVRCPEGYLLITRRRHSCPIWVRLTWSPHVRACA